MGRPAQVLLRDLQLNRQPGARHGAKERVKRLAGHKVERAVLDLQDDIVAKLSVQSRELPVSLPHAVELVVRRVDKGPPEEQPAMGRERLGKQIGSFRMGALIIVGAGLTLRVGLDEETAEIGDQRVNLRHLGPPPGLHGRIERIRGLESADFNRRAEPGGEVHADAVGTKLVGQRRHFAQVVGRQDERAGIDVVEHGAVEPDRRERACIIAVTPVAHLGQVIPVPKGKTGIAALDKPVEVVPVVQNPVGNARSADGRQLGEWAVHLQVSQQRKGAAQHSGVARRRNRHD